MLRPERLQILEAAVPDHLNVLQGQVRDVVYQGDSVLVQVTLPDGSDIGVRTVSTRGAMAAIPQAGAKVMLGLEPEDTTLLPAESAPP